MLEIFIYFFPCIFPGSNIFVVLIRDETHLPERDVLAVLKLNDILPPIDDFKASIRMELSDIPGVKPAHAFLINLRPDICERRKD